jgi:hypothetical protein
MIGSPPHTAGGFFLHILAGKKNNGEQSGSFNVRTSINKKF